MRAPAQVDAAGIDMLLVGDSVAMVVHGFPSTLHATMDMMVAHVAAVCRGAPNLVVVADMPFVSVRRGKAAATEAAARLMQAGATAVKLEGVRGHEEVFAHLIGSGIPVMGHLGLMPQAVNVVGGYRIQGRTDAEAERLREEARTVEECGAFAMVLECVPAALAASIAAEREIPTIGIGAGRETAGQVLVLADLLGYDARFRPSFVRRYVDGHGLVLDAINHFVRDVRTAGFPAETEVPA